MQSQGNLDGLPFAAAAGGEGTLSLKTNYLEKHWDLLLVCTAPSQVSCMGICLPLPVL